MSNSFECNAIGMPDVNTGNELQLMKIKRRAVGPNDVHLELKAASICHSDLHFIKQEWGPLKGKQCPGHEMIGKAVAVGANVKNIELGKLYAVGCMVGSNCVNPDSGEFTCSSCTVDKDEVYCEKGNIGTYGSREVVDGVEQVTYGGYSTDIIIDSKFAVEVPEFFHDKLHLATAIACAGITVYTPLKRAGCAPGKKVGVNGIGGLGMYAVKIAQAMGAEVIGITRTQAKVQELKDAGAKDVIVSTVAENFEPYKGKLDIIIDTVSAKHDLGALLNLLRPHGALGLVGASPDPLEFHTFSLIMGSKQLFGSLIGSIEQTQEVYNLCAEHKILVPVEVIKPEQINEAYDRLVKCDVHYRFAIDIEALRAAKIE